MHDGNHRGEEATEETTSAPLAAIAPVITSSSGGRARPARIKVVSLGAAGVGKSCLIKRHCEGKFVARYVPTIGVDYGVKPLQLGGHEVRAGLWDMAGPSAYALVREELYRDAGAALLAFDVRSRRSFAALPRWLAEAARCGAPAGMAVCVAGNQCDAAPAARRVPEAEAREWAAARGFSYFEVSALTGASVDALFAALFAQALARTPGVPQAAVAAALGAADAAAAAAAAGGGGGGGSDDVGAEDQCAGE